MIVDAPDRGTPYSHQMTVGYTRQIGAAMAVGVDYVRSMNRDMFLARNLNPMRRADTTRTGAITRSDAFGVLGDTYSQQVWLMENTGENNYDALNLSLEKRMSYHWSGRVSYSLGYSRGTAENQADRNTYQTGTSLNLDRWAALGTELIDDRSWLDSSALPGPPVSGSRSDSSPHALSLPSSSDRNGARRLLHT